MPRGWAGRGIGWRGNPFPFCRWFPWLPRWWWAWGYTPWMLPVGWGYPAYYLPWVGSGWFAHPLTTVPPIWMYGRR
ncbi:MAG TPA: hypothetical protein EYP10_05155 [Armatimonadetes bacterium]|nr:hypothetical protein [Armatimonadota bacterium]